MQVNHETLCNFAGKKEQQYMISFECDYNNGACQQVLDNLIKYNNAKPTPYGFDEFSERAKDRIREACGLPDAQIFFLTGGTQTNATTIDSMLYQYEGVICVGSGHINVHEAGAVEFTEHKIITIGDTNGKMEAKTLDKYLDDYMHDGNKDHAVCTQVWCISPFLRSSAPFTPPKSSMTSIRYVSAMRYHFILTGPVLAMD